MKRIAALLAGLALAVSARAETLEQGFADPPQSARPRVWWHWLAGNVTQAGIASDLAWMKSVGIGGMQNFSGDLGTPQVVANPVGYRSPAYYDLLRFTAAEADRLGLEFTVAASAGWSETGGPWVTPAEGMKKLVWSEIEVAGGHPLSGPVPAAPVTSGPFQDAPLPAPLDVGALLGKPMAKSERVAPLYARDVAILAYRVPAGEDAVPLPRVATNTSPLSVAMLADGRFASSQPLAVARSGATVVSFDYGHPVTLRGFTMGIAQPGEFAPAFPVGRVEASEDGRRFRPIAALPGRAGAGFPAPYPVRSFAFPAATARRFRVTLDPPAPEGFPGMPPKAPTTFQITEMAFHAAATVERFEAKAAYAAVPELDRDPTPAVAPDAAIAPATLIDLTGHLRADGTLDWTPPPGRWRIMRFGFSLTGIENHPAAPDATGLEVDKLDATRVRHYLEQYLAPLKAKLGPLLGKRGLTHLLTDSVETGNANWTETMPAEFARRRGYALLPWLPALAGHVVESAAASDRFLWDYRRTIAELYAENHFGTIAAVAHEYGLKYYGEAMGTGLPVVGDGLANKRFTDIPMGESWQVAPGAPSDPAHVADLTEAASAAHVYGQNLVGAEAFTAFPDRPPFTATPALLKPLADRFMAEGVNRFQYHASVHQPTDGGPGMTLGPFGQYFSRNETWGPLARGWIDYLARSSLLLQQGHYAADVALFYGEDGAVTVPAGAIGDPALPAGYAADFVSRDALIDLFAMKDGRIVTPSGMSYAVLVLPPSAERLSLAVLRRIDALVRDGAVLVGPEPVASPSLADDPAEVRRLAGALWGLGTAPHVAGKGRVYRTQPLADVLAAEGVAPDIRFAGAPVAPLWLHRRLAEGGDLYFIANPSDRAMTLEASLRAAGRAAELWHAETGRRDPATFSIAGGRTTVPLALAPHDAVFVVLRTPTTDVARTVAPPARTELARLDDGWTLSVPGASPAMPAPLGSWTANGDPRIRFFSGIARYDRTVDIRREWIGKRRQLRIELGEVHEVARVSVDGRVVGEAWQAPFAVDLGDALTPGRHRITIEVANLWPNRMIGDAQPGATKQARTTFPFPAYDAASPLLPSGLIGPVRLIAETR